jgi:hypothetical protein
MFSFAQDRQPTRVPADASGEAYQRPFRRAFRPDATTPAPETRSPRDVAVPQADGEP